MSRNHNKSAKISGLLAPMFGHPATQPVIVQGTDLASVRAAAKAVSSFLWSNALTEPVGINAWVPQE